MANPAHGGTLKDLVLRDEDIHQELLREAQSLPSITLDERQLCDLELILNGGFSPLEGFLDEKDYHSVVNDLRLENGLVWPIPVTLDATEQEIRDQQIRSGARFVLRDPRDDAALAVLTGNTSHAF